MNVADECYAASPSPLLCCESGLKAAMAFIPHYLALVCPCMIATDTDFLCSTQCDVNTCDHMLGFFTLNECEKSS